MIIYYYWILYLTYKLNIYKEEIDFSYKPLDDLNKNNDIVNDSIEYNYYSSSIEFLEKNISDV
jgi:hypothetical protein